MLLSRRSFARLFVASAASGLVLAATGPASADAPGTATADRHAAPPGSIGKGQLRLALTPGDNGIRSRCIGWTMKGPTGKVQSWRNPKTGNRGTVKPTGKAERHAGRSCRSFEETITLKDGRTETISGRACQKADGGWEVVA